MTAIGRDVGKVVALVVLEDHLPGVAVGLILVNVEEPLVALVAADEERRVVLGPAVERGFQPFPGRQVGDGALGVLDVDVVQLVPALVAGVEEALIVGEVAHSDDVVVGRGGELHRLAAGHGEGVSVVDPGLVAADQQLAVVRRERGTGVIDIAQKVLDAVLGHLKRGGLLRAGPTRSTFTSLPPSRLGRQSLRRDRQRSTLRFR